MKPSHLLVLWGFGIASAISPPAAAAPGECPEPSAGAARVTQDPGTHEDEETRAARAAVRAAREALEAGRLVEADQRTAEGIDRVRGLPPGSARVQLLLHLGVTMERLSGQVPFERDALMARAAAAFSEAADLAAEVGDQRLRSFALGHQGAVYEGAGRDQEALLLTRQALFAAQAADAPDALYRWQWQLGRLQRAAGETDRALEAYRQAVGTLGRIRQQTVFSDGGSEASFRHAVEPVYLEALDLLLYRASFTEDAEQQQHLLAEARDALEDLKAAELRDYFHDECLDSQRKASPDAIPGALVVYPILLPDRLELIVSRYGRGLQSYVSPVKGEALTAEVRALRRKLENRASHAYRRHAERLYDWLIRPIEPALRETQIEALVFVPGGSLRTVPMAALRDRETGQFLIEKVPVATTPGLTLTDPRSIDPERARMLRAGISQPVQGYGALENVSHEIEAAQQAFAGRTLMNDEFSTGRFENEVTGSSFGIVHIASHGEFMPEASESFLLTYDGRLAMDRLSDLVGATQFRDMPLELLALSACETAVGDDRAALGLAGVAVRSGARSALATLWSVNDEAAAELISEFYRQLAEPGVSRARALQRAQLKLLSTYRYRHPGYWSPFVLISSWL